MRTAWIRLIRWASLPALSLTLSLPLPLLAQERNAPLQVAVSRSLAPPFVVWRDNQPIGGIEHEIAGAVAAQLKTTVEFHVLPRLRVEAALASGEADMACNLSPLSSPRTESLPLGPVLFNIEEMLAGHESATLTDSLEQLPEGTAVGTLQGQVYPAMDPLFATGKLRRDDALTEESMLRKLALARHPYGISNRQSLGWFASQPGGDRLASWRLPVSSRPYRCTLSPRGRFEARQLLAALEQLQASGRIEAIVASHAPPALAVVVSTRSTLRNVSRSALTELFLGQRSRLADGSAPEPVMAGGQERNQFMAAVLKRDAAQFRAAWAAQQFGGRRRPPTELASAEAVKSHLQRHAEAIGFLPLSLVDSSLRIVYLP